MPRFNVKHRLSSGSALDSVKPLGAVNVREGKRELSVGGLAAASISPDSVLSTSAL
jgi:hypothetical protein